MTDEADHWIPIREALGAEEPGYTYVDFPDECWFSIKDRGLRVWSQGVMHLDPAPTPVSVPRSRQVFFHYDEGCWVELTEYAEGGRLICAVDNGAFFRAALDPSQFAAKAAHLGGLGFREVNAWNLSADTILWREYRRERTEKVVVSVDGVVCSGREDATCDSREAAEARGEAEIRALLEDGYELVRMEQWDAQHENPPVASEPALPELRDYPEPQSANEAVDQAIARITELHRLLPNGHLVVELLDLPDAQPRLDALGHEHFTEWYSEQLGRWLEPGSGDGATSSFDYFVKRYGTLTWVVRSGSPDDLPTFYVGNVCGGGLSPLQINSHDYGYLEEHADAMEEPRYLELNVFHGGWHDGMSYAFDTRFTSPDGEHPIIHFDECEPTDFDDTAPESIQPFGFWLLERVKETSAQLVPWLSRFQEVCA